MAMLTRGERFKDARNVFNRNGKQTLREVEQATGVNKAKIQALEDDDNSRSVGYEDIAVLAKHYGISSDFLLGLSDIRTVDADISAICEFTGLSEDTVLLLHCVSNLGEVVEDNSFSKSRIVTKFMKKAQMAKDSRLLKFELYRLIEVIINIIAEAPLLFGPAFQNFVFGTINSVIGRCSHKEYTPDEEIISELNAHGFQVMESNRYAEWQLNLVFDELKHRAKVYIFQHAKKNYGE